MPVTRTQHSVIVVGSSNTDLVISCPRLPKPGETLLGGDFQRFAGGKGANQAVAAARAGAHVVFLGGRGDDDLGRAALAGLRAEGIGTRHFTARPGVPSGVALILLGGKTKENMIAVAKSANDAVTPADIAVAESDFRKAGVVVAQLETPLPAVRAAAELARKHNVPFLLNPAPARPLPAALLKLVSLLTPNEHEAELLTGEKDPMKAGVALQHMGCREVVVTLGAKGALLIGGGGDRGKEVRLFSAPKVKPVDTVGAGDCFTGWLAAGLAKGKPLAEVIPLALKAASLSVTRAGAQPSFPKLSEM